MEGIAVSAEKVAETYKGDGAANGGTAGTGSNDTANYAETNGGSNSGDYEKAAIKSTMKSTAFIKKSLKARIKCVI